MNRQRYRRNATIRKWAEKRAALDHEIYVGVDKMIDHDLALLKASVSSMSTTNCWAGEYDLRGILSDAIRLSEQRRLDAASRLQEEK